jgi:glycosyltransferase involved in cell wall biosynthesis
MDADTPLGKGSISACLVVRNEGAVIERCLTSLHGAVDEIILIHDGECEDATLDIAQRFGCRIFQHDLVGHSEAATVFAFDEARGEWLLAIDADEFLSASLREALRQLVCNADVNGYELLWRMWDGRRYITLNGPYKLALYRRSCVHVLGLIHCPERVDPPVVRVELQLEHRPNYNNFTLRTMLTKWRRWARIHARELTSDFSTLPKFNWDESDWPARRRLLNRLSPVMVLPSVPLVFLVNVVRSRDVYSARENIRMARGQALYAGMVQFYVAKYVYGAKRDSDTATEPPLP